MSAGRAKKYTLVSCTRSSVNAIMIAPTMRASTTASTEMIALPVVIWRNIVCHLDGGGASEGSATAPGPVAVARASSAAVPPSGEAAPGSSMATSGSGSFAPGASPLGCWGSLMRRLLLRGLLRPS